MMNALVVQYGALLQNLCSLPAESCLCFVIPQPPSVYPSSNLVIILSVEVVYTDFFESVPSLLSRS